MSLEKIKLNNNKIWNIDLNELYFNYRKMGTIQIESFYNISIDIIKYNLKKHNYNINKKQIINSLSNNEIIFMYNSLLKGEIKSLTNGIFSCNNGEKYAIIMFQFLINSILKWNKNDICDKYSLKILDEYKMKGIISSLKFSVYDFVNLSFPEYNVKPWELKKSTVGNGYWKNEDNVKSFSEYIKENLIINHNINNINEAAVYGFRKIIEEFGGTGLISAKKDFTDIKLFELVYNTKFNKEEMLKINYKFEINNNEVNRKLENLLYKITKEYDKLDLRGKTLINEIVRYCEENNKFPKEKDMSKKNGYISRTQYYKYFNEKNFKEVYKYIIPVDNGEKGGGKKQLVQIEKIRPKTTKCIKCGIEKPFTEEYFCNGKNSKYGLKYECKECAAKKATKKHYNDIGIIYDNITDISPEQWWEYLYKNILGLTMPKFCYLEENEIKIIKYIINKKINLTAKEDIINKFVGKNIEEYKIDMMIYNLGGKLKTLQKVFPELNFIEQDFKFNKYSKEYMILIIDKCLNNYGYTILNILNNNVGLKREEQDFKDLRAMISYKFHKNNKDTIDMFLWYFKEKNIKHPIYNKEIIRYDFKIQSNNYWKNKQNRIDRIKYYCEIQCKESILNVIKDTDKLKKWSYEYFKQEDIDNNKLPYTPYNHSLYDTLIEAYPSIKKNKILFNWEWHQWSKYDKNFLIKMLKEFILYRMNNLIIDLKKDIPKYLNMSNLDAIMPKFNKHIDRKRFESYYEWACESFPEYKNEWTKEDFGQIVAKDGIKLGSYQEKDIYEFIKYKTNLKYIHSIGNKRSGKYVFELPENSEYKRFCPDFIIEYINTDGNKNKLTKPLIIEYYGMYVENHKHKIYQNYVKKTKIKEKFYKSRDDIYYLGIFPEDIKEDFKGLIEKLNSFFMQNFNININI